MVESNKLARKTVRTKWYSEKKNEPVDNTVHIPIRIAEKYCSLIRCERKTLFLRWKIRLIRQANWARPKVPKPSKLDWLDGNYIRAREIYFPRWLKNFGGSNQSDRIDRLSTWAGTTERKRSTWRGVHTWLPAWGRKRTSTTADSAPISHLINQAANWPGCPSYSPFVLSAADLQCDLDGYLGSETRVSDGPPLHRTWKMLLIMISARSWSVAVT
jgi:hypothetical protein